MKEALRYGLTLGIICVMASGLLAGVNSLTKDKILAQAQEAENAGLREVMLEGETFEPVKEGDRIIYYKLYDKRNKFSGVAFKASGKGYSGEIETMVGMTKEGMITAIKILNQNETPGLGSRIAESLFTGEFKNKDINDLSSVQAITGATISSTGVIDSVKKKVEEIKALIKNER